jgi:hypothetical protein
MINISIPDDCFKVTFTTANTSSAVRIAFMMPGGIIDTMELWVNLEPAAVRSQLDTIFCDAGFQPVDDATYERVTPAKEPES